MSLAILPVFSISAASPRGIRPARNERSIFSAVRNIVTQLRPGVLDDLGLIAAIEWQAEEFRNRSGIHCELDLEQQEVTLDRDRATAIFRIFQEALTNVARHAEASSVWISLKERAGTLVLEIRDNGRGITQGEISSSRSDFLVWELQPTKNLMSFCRIESTRSCA